VTVRLILAALAVAAASGGASAGSGDQRFDTFLETCVPDRQDYQATRLRAEAAGWKAAAEGAHPSLRRVLAKSAQAGQNPDIRLSFAAYQRQIGERSYYLVVVLAGSRLVDLVGCYLYDFAADQPTMPRLLIDWLEGVPDETKYVPGTIIASKWDQPTGLPGTLTCSQRLSRPGASSFQRSASAGWC
jgi:hypothetical protein